jgi:hypothetical protein
MILGCNQVGLAEILDSWALYLDGCKMWQLNHNATVRSQMWKCLLPFRREMIYVTSCETVTVSGMRERDMRGREILDTYDYRIMVKKVNLWRFFINHYAMRSCGGIVVQLHTFLFSALAGIEWSAWRFDLFTPEERATCAYWIGRRASGCGTLETRSK